MYWQIIISPTLINTIMITITNMSKKAIHVTVLWILMVELMVTSIIIL